MSYEQLLKRGIKELPEVVTETVRFEVPKVRGHVEGNKTVISNFNQIADVLHRPKEHILKFLQKELATPGEFK
ncbi:translation initiation factor IF-2 subunit beta, partial [Nanoarchaeota archaeon]